MIAFLLGLQGGYTKHSCFLCLWNSRANEQHYLVKNWPARKDFIPGSHNQGCGSGYFSTASASTNKKRENDR